MSKKREVLKKGQYSTVQYNTAQYSTVGQDRIGQGNLILPYPDFSSPQMRMNIVIKSRGGTRWEEHMRKIRLIINLVNHLISLRPLLILNLF